MDVEQYYDSEQQYWAVCDSSVICVNLWAETIDCIALQAEKRSQTSREVMVF